MNAKRRGESTRPSATPVSRSTGGVCSPPPRPLEPDEVRVKGRLQDPEQRARDALAPEELPE